MKVMRLMSNEFDNESDQASITEIRKVFEACNINFLFGSGFSSNILETLGNVEIILEYVQKQKQEKYRIIEALTYWRFFQQSIFPVMNLNNENPHLIERFKFMEVLSQLIEKRGNTTNSKRINVFTTNYDPVIELAFENNSIIYNDGFNGRIFPIYCTSNFNRTYYSQTLFTDKLVEIPVFNLVKIHGSMTWGKNDQEDRYVYRDMNQSIKKFFDEFENLYSPFAEIDESFKAVKNPNIDIENIINTNEKLFNNANALQHENFINDYKSNFEIINPTKEKFQETIFNKTYHELLRIYSNELEKINTVLLVFGFSFKDEHIHEITRRALGNPTLKIYIFAYKEEHIKMYKEKFSSNNNVCIVYYDESAVTVEKRSGNPLIDLKFFTDILQEMMR